MVRVAASLVAVGLLLGGCTKLGPDFVRPDAPVADDWIESKDPKVEEKPDETIFRQWWTVFNDPVLDELIQTAYRQNLDLQIAGIRILEARAQLGIAVGSLYPQSQTVGADATANQTSRNAPGALGRDFFYTMTLASMPLGSSISGAVFAAASSRLMPTCSPPSPTTTMCWCR